MANDVCNDLEPRIRAMEVLLDAMSEKMELTNAIADENEANLAACVAFIRDVWLNKYPTKPRIIAAAGRLLDEIEVR